MLTLVIGVILGIAADKYLVSPLVIKATALLATIKAKLVALKAKI